MQMQEKAEVVIDKENLPGAGRKSRTKKQENFQKPGDEATIRYPMGGKKAIDNFKLLSPSPYSVNRRRRRPNDLSASQRALFPCICFLLTPSYLMCFI